MVRLRGKFDIDHSRHRSAREVIFSAGSKSSFVDMKLRNEWSDGWKVAGMERERDDRTFRVMDEWKD